MAENFLALEGAGGTPVAADEVTLNGTVVKVQYVKFLDGTDNGTDRIPGSAARGLLVEMGGFGSSIRTRSVNVTAAGGLLSALSGTAALANRKNLMLVNNGAARIWLGSGAGLGVIPLDPGVPFAVDWAAGIDPYLISTSGTQALGVLETA